MKSLKWRSYFATAAFLAGMLGLGLTVADDKPAADKPDQEKKEQPAREVIRRVVTAVSTVGTHWIGVHAIPVSDEALKSQLNLKDRLIVVHVLPDSPSDKGGVKQHDILLKFGDKELHSLEDLVKAVGENGDKEAKLLVLRGGKEQTLTIVPAERPSEDVVAKIQEAHPQDLRVWLEHAIKVPTDEHGRYVLRMLGPGVAAGAFAKAAAFPDGLSISVSKENDQPAKIVAKKDGKTYEATGDKLDDLPDDIRVHVERLLHAPQALTWTGDAWKTILQNQDPKTAESVKKAIETARKNAADQANEARSRVDEQNKAVRHRIELQRVEGGPLESLRKEVEALRKDLEKLKGNKDARGQSDEKEAEKQ